AEHQEDSLETVLAIRFMAEHSATNAQDHRSVPPKQRLEGRIVAPLNESIQQFGVSRAGAGRHRNSAHQPADRSAQKMANHDAYSREPGASVVIEPPSVPACPEIRFSARYASIANSGAPNGPGMCRAATTTRWPVWYVEISTESRICSSK